MSYVWNAYVETMGFRNVVLEEEHDTEVSELKQRINELEFILRNIINDLPSKRDWLDPMLEMAAREILCQT